ncbi:MAG: hypothetical protein MRY81_02300 [Donghicola eburneus]|nr:hypothetical protein [Donghicola eburneus]MCI5038492.1 hypothetical protein [Donghicola eburneus]
MRIAAANFAFQTLSALKEYGRTGATNLVEDHWLAPHPLWDQDHNLKAVFSKVSKIMVEEKGVPKETADEICQRAATYWLGLTTNGSRLEKEEDLGSGFITSK